MAEPLDFYFDFTSPYGYLMSEKIDELAARFDRKVRWHPVLLGIIFKATGSQPPIGLPLKGEYLLLDVQRSARFLDIPYRHPSRFPLATQAAGRAYYWLHQQDCALARRFAHAVYRACFIDDQDISSPVRIVEIATGLGVDKTALENALANPEVKASLQTACELALKRGVFGSPYVFIDEQPFFGVDRLPQIERWLDSGGF